MNIEGRAYRTIWHSPDQTVHVIDQTQLPHVLEIRRVPTAEEAADAIRRMIVRGAPLIGVTAAYGLALALRDDSSDEALEKAFRLLLATRPTAVNLRWALTRMRRVVLRANRAERASVAWKEAVAIADEDVETCRRIGDHGFAVLMEAARKKNGNALNVLTHCNAGWLAAVDWGTALAPIYAAYDSGVSLHVWVDETRPRNQGTSLTAYELGAHGVPHTIITDNAGGHLMQSGSVDLCIVGADRIAANGDVANKVGTYLKALAAKDTGVPFYVAFPASTIDWTLQSGSAIPIEERAEDEVTTMAGRLPDGSVATVVIAPRGSPARNPAFDVTPARLLTSFITERGTCDASAEGLRGLFPHGDESPSADVDPS
jgi:methylthioribose-1-phosphate isomerase